MTELTELQQLWAEKREKRRQERDNAALFILRTLTSRMSVLSPDRDKALELAYEYSVDVKYLFNIAKEKAENV